MVWIFLAIAAIERDKFLFNKELSGLVYRVTVKGRVTCVRPVAVQGL
jgi:hypothetical protein